MNSKTSRLRRKYLNAMRGMADVPWPARRFKYPATTGNPIPTNRRCAKILALEPRRRRGWRWLVDLIRRRRPITRAHVCGAPLFLVPHSALRRGHLACPRGCRK
jgi:hypothetical protein